MDTEVDRRYGRWFNHPVYIQKWPLSAKERNARTIKNWQKESASYVQHVRESLHQNIISRDTAWQDARWRRPGTSGAIIINYSSLTLKRLRSRLVHAVVSCTGATSAIMKQRHVLVFLDIIKNSIPHSHRLRDRRAVPNSATTAVIPPKCRSNRISWQLQHYQTISVRPWTGEYNLTSARGGEEFCSGREFKKKKEKGEKKSKKRGKGKKKQH